VIRFRGAEGVARHSDCGPGSGSRVRVDNRFS